MDTQPVGLAFCKGSLLAEPQMQGVEGVGGDAVDDASKCGIRGEEWLICPCGKCNLRMHNS
ncbi:hypothetical protein GCM10027022_01930 [Alpinimonas psychrophila]